MANGNDSGYDTIQPDQPGGAPSSPSPVTEANAPAPVVAPPSQQAGPGSMAQFPLNIGPPRDEDHFNERKAGWKRVLENTSSNPAMMNALLSMGTQMMQPTLAKGAGAQVGSAGRGLEAAAESYATSRQAQLAQEEQQRKAGLEERRVVSEEERTRMEGKRTEADVARSTADIDRIKEETDKLRAENKDLPDRLKSERELRLKQIENAASEGKLREAQLALEQEKLKQEQDPRVLGLKEKKLEAELAEAQARTAAAKSMQEGGPEAARIRFLMREGGMDFREAADLAIGKGTYLTDKRQREAADDIGGRIAEEWKRSGGKDERGKPLDLSTWLDSKLQRWAIATGGKADFIGMIGKSATSAITGATVPQGPSGPGSLKSRPVSDKDVDATAKATGLPRDQVIDAMRSQGYDVSRLKGQVPEAQGLDSGN